MTGGQTWHKYSTKDTIQKLRGSRQGLRSKQAQQRLKQYGPNVLPAAAGRTALQIWGRQFASPLMLLLIAAAGVSFALRDTIDAQVILAAVVLNVVVGFIQEYRAERTLESLRKVVTFDALVLRDGVERSVAAQDIVPGDVLVVRAGMRVVADARLLEVNDLQVNEASLTGESTPVEKIHSALDGHLGLGDQHNMLFNGTTVIAGSGQAIVVATGTSTEFGQIAQTVQNVKEDATPWQQRLQRFSRFITLVVLGVAAAIFILGAFTGRSLPEMFAVSVAIAVAAIPEGLAIGVTVVLVIGMRRILQQQALTRQLVAVETLGAISVLCFDKTGTVTEGNMAVVRVVTENHDLHASSDELHAHSKDVASTKSTVRLFKIALLCNDAHIENEDKALEHRLVTGNPTERALVNAAHALGLTRHALESDAPRVASIPFSSNRKFMLTVHHDAQGDVAYAKGAPEVILQATHAIDLDGKEVKIHNDRRRELLQRAETLSREGLRVLAFAYARLPDHKNDEPSALPQLTFVGFAGLKDPLRAEAKTAVQALQHAGIHAAMITGDHKFTAQAIAKELGLPIAAKHILTGQDLERLSDADLQKKIRGIHVYARVSAKDKIRIVKAWKALGEVVAMTGDGINDAAALKAADVGIGLGSGTEVAKEAAKVILLNDNIQTIESAVEQGRIIFENIKKVTLYLLSDAFSAVILVALSLLGGLPLALSAAQILWINLVTDGLPNMALTIEPKERNVMAEKPRPRSEPLLDQTGKIFVASISAVTGVLSFILFFIVLRESGNEILARSVAYAALGTTTLLYAFSLRHIRQGLFSGNPFQNRWLNLAVGVGLILQIGVLYWAPLQHFLGTTAIDWTHWKLIFVMNITVLLFIEALKLFVHSGKKKAAA
ncbi:MAG: HAD-IC family P-type ATPase [Candidatus Nomurabacteria bacterium]|nr:MAG: HAD-IC family P-type ATPase [Candidatus Nomurabacteria bacterium]